MYERVGSATVLARRQDGRYRAFATGLVMLVVMGAASALDAQERSQFGTGRPVRGVADRFEQERLRSPGERAVRSAEGPWWKEDADQTVVHPNRFRPGRGVRPNGEIMKTTEIIAWVGNEPILAGDLLGRINEVLQPAIGKAPEEEIERQRGLLMERMLPAAIESKMVYVDFIKNLKPEQISAIRVGVYKQFDEKQLPRLIEQAKVRTAADLEEQLRTYGTSIENVRRSFFEQVAAREMIRKNSEDDSEVTHDDLLAYYREHLDDYAFDAKARWEKLTVRFDRFSSKREAYAAIVAMGNSVLRGASFAAVAKRESQGFRAEQGGRYDWTNEGSLVSEILDEQIFAAPVGEMGEIIEDGNGFHILRVVERVPAGRTSFVEAQVEIREKIKEERRDAKVQAYLALLKQQIYVWNKFEEATAIAERPSSVDGSPRRTR